ncbi:hypothetical protein [Acinetobacter sp. CE-15]|uniref:hypothetical protein n=1 Tax=Acinetobacter sp. CE-15 TaxID=3425693 RepID=UPI003DA232D6
MTASNSKVMAIAMQSKNHFNAYSTVEFVEKAREKFGDKFDYSKVVYINSQTLIEITCPTHGRFYQKPQLHINSITGCKLCGIESRKKSRALSVDSFIERSSAIHQNRYKYDNVVYSNNTSKVLITCLIHGDFLQTPANHLKGKGCIKCANECLRILKKSDSQEFIKKALVVHGGLYGYEKVVYVSAIQEVIIRCSIHGYFTQTPNAHLSGSGCYICKGGIRWTLENFFKKARRKHGSRYDYSKIKSYKNKNSKLTIICKKHGVFHQTAIAHLKSVGCAECAAETNRSGIKHSKISMLARFTKTHGKRYDYSLVSYINYNTRVKIICQKHGVFEQTPATHWKGGGCATCLKEESPTYMFGRKAHIKFCKRKNSGLSKLYVLKCHSKDEMFYKVGITCNSVKARFNNKAAMPYDYSIVIEVVGEAGFIFDLETRVHQLSRGFKYKPLKDFGGKSECFSKLSKPILGLLNKLNESKQIECLT